MKLPFRPWWWHPNHNYVGKHRGTYQFRDQKAAIPIGTRVIKITPYLDAHGLRLAPESQTISMEVPWSEMERTL